MTQINPRSPLPKYHQLRGILLELINAEPSADQPIPSERELQDRYGVSRVTVRKAIEQLVAEGRLYRVSGLGTFVSRQKADVPVQLSSFSEDMAARGLPPKQVTYRLEVGPGPAVAARELGIDAGDPVIALDRLRMAGGRPVCFERAHLPARLLPDFTGRWSDGSLYALLAERYALRPTWSEQHIGAAAADDVLAKALDVPVGAPLLRVRQRAYCREVIVEYCVSFYRPDLYELSITLSSTDATAPTVAPLSGPATAP